MANAGTVNVNLVARTAQFAADIARAKLSLGGMASSVLNMRTALAGLASAWAVNEVREFVGRSMEAIDANVKLADRIGITTQSMGGLAYAAKLSGIESQQLGSSMTKLSAKIGEAVNGSKSARDDIKQLGLDFGKLAAQAPDEQFLSVADAINKMGTAAERTAAAQSIFGKSGSELLPMFISGAEAIRAQVKEAEALGLAMNRVDSEKVVQANDAITTAGAALEGVANTLAVAVAPIIQGVAEHFVQASKDSNGFRETALNAFEWVLKAVGKFADAWQVLQMGWYAAKATVLLLFEAVQYGVHGGIIAFVTLREYGSALWDILKAGAGSAAAGMSIAWSYVKQAFAEMIAFLGDKWAGFQRTLASAVEIISDDTAASMRAAANRVAAGVQSMRDSAAAGVAASKRGAEESARDMAAALHAITNIDVMNSGIVQSSRAAIAQTHAAATEAAMDFKRVKDQAWNSDELDAFFKKARAGSEALAQTNAKKADNRLVADATARAAAVEAANKAEAEKVRAAWETTYHYVQRLGEGAGTALAEGMAKTREQMEAQAVRRAPLANDIDGMRASINAEKLAEIDRYNAKIEALKQYHEDKLITESEHNLLEEELRAQHEANLAGISDSWAERNRKFERMTGEQKMQFASQVFGNLTSLMNTNSRKMFEIGKASAYAQAIVNTAQGVTAALSLGLPGIALAASIAAAGAVQIATIAGQTFNGGGGSVSAGPGAAVDAFAENNANRSAGNNEPVRPRSIDINLGDDDVVLVGKAGVRRFIEKINEAIGDGVQLRVA